MLESMSPVSLDELEQLLKSLNERVKYLEKVVAPSRVTKEELHGGVSDAKLFVMSTASSLRAEIRLLKQLMVSRDDLDQLKQELFRQTAAPQAARPPRRNKRAVKS